MSPAPLNPRTMYGLIAIIPLVSRSANNSKSTNPPEPCASVVVFSFVDHATIQFVARHQSSVIFHPPSNPSSRPVKAKLLHWAIFPQVWSPRRPISSAAAAFGIS